MEEKPLGVSNTGQLCLILKLHHKRKCNKPELQHQSKIWQHREPYADVARLIYLRQTMTGKLTNSAKFPKLIPFQDKEKFQ